MTSALKEELKKWLSQLASDEMKDPTRYHDSGMLFRQLTGVIYKQDKDTVRRRL